MKNSIKMIFLLLTLLLTVGCGNLQKVSISDIQSPKLRSLSGSVATIEIRVKINNPSSHQLYLKTVDFDILRNGYSFAEAKLNEKLTIAKHSDTYYPVYIDVKFTDIFALAAGGIKLLNQPEAWGQFSATGKVKGGNWLFNKTYKVKDVKMTDLVK